MLRSVRGIPTDTEASDATYHTGHEAETPVSQGSTHCEWNRCSHGSARRCCRAINLSKQIAHSGPGSMASGPSGGFPTWAASGACTKAAVAPSARAVISRCALLVPSSTALSGSEPGKCVSALNSLSPSISKAPKGRTCGRLYRTGAEALFGISVRCPQPRITLTETTMMNTDTNTPMRQYITTMPA